MPQSTIRRLVSPHVPPRSSLAHTAIIVLAIVNGLTTCLVLAVALLCHKPVMRALLLMVTGVSLIWIYLAGTFMFMNRERIRTTVHKLRLDWRIVFVLFCTLLALLEEVVTTTMTNCAPLFGVPIGRAYVTASTNYLDVVCLHSVVVFVPMFIGWAWMLSKWRFGPSAVLLLYGITGVLAEVMFGGPTAVLMSPFWIFVYGLMVYLPTYCVPDGRNAKRPRLQHYLMAPILPMLLTVPVALVMIHIHPIKMHFPPIKVETAAPK